MKTLIRLNNDETYYSKAVETGSSDSKLKNFFASLAGLRKSLFQLQRNLDELSSGINRARKNLELVQ